MIAPANIGVGSVASFWYDVASLRCASPSLIYFSLSTTVSVDPLSACLMIMLFILCFSDWTAALCCIVRLDVDGLRLLLSVVFNSLSVLLRYCSSVALPDELGVYLDLGLKGCFSLSSVS